MENGYRTFLYNLRLFSFVPQMRTVKMETPTHVVPQSSQPCSRTPTAVHIKSLCMYMRFAYCSLESNSLTIQDATERH